MTREIMRMALHDGIELVGIADPRSLTAVWFGVSQDHGDVVPVDLDTLLKLYCTNEDRITAAIVDALAAMGAVPDISGALPS